ARIHGDGIFEEHVQQNGVLAENLQHTVINLQNFQLSTEAGSGIKVVGAAGFGNSHLAIFGAGFAANVDGNQQMYEITNGGNLVVEDVWYEASSRLAYLVESGTFTINGGHISTNPGTPIEPVINVTGFNGS